MQKLEAYCWWHEDKEISEYQKTYNINPNVSFTKSENSVYFLANPNMLYTFNVCLELPKSCLIYCKNETVVSGRYGDGK